ncbi:hypothetical protein GE061_003275 [Apolygus lucorum]|uniref:Uncharacterized protein n=1 Tax=Apolygus lucorum TaxID=248454 RepID=A0A8S9X328_APOLU|nr:hypothetical protein GE061_003275 [Apolygus lucorum]
MGTNYEITSRQQPLSSFWGLARMVERAQVNGRLGRSHTCSVLSSFIPYSWYSLTASKLLNVDIPTTSYLDDSSHRNNQQTSRRHRIDSLLLRRTLLWLPGYQIARLRIKNLYCSCSPGEEAHKERIQGAQQTSRRHRIDSLLLRRTLLRLPRYQIARLRIKNLYWGKLYIMAEQMELRGQ